MADLPPVQQLDGSVLIQGPQMLAAAYQSVLAGIKRRRADGLPSADLQQLARALRRAHIDASRPRHRLAETLPAGSCCTCQDGELVSVAAAARMLSVGKRQVQRPAGQHGGDRPCAWR